MPLVSFSGIGPTYISVIANDPDPNSPYKDIVAHPLLNEFDLNLLAYMEITRSLIETMKSDVDMRLFATVTKRLLAAASSSAATYDLDQIEVEGNLPVTTSSLTATDAVRVFFGFGTVGTTVKSVPLGVNGGSLPTADSVVTALNASLTTVIGLGTRLRAYATPDGRIGFRISASAVAEGYYLGLTDPAPGTPSLLSKLGITPGNYGPPRVARASAGLEAGLAMLEKAADRRN